MPQLLFNNRAKVNATTFAGMTNGIEGRETPIVAIKEFNYPAATIAAPYNSLAGLNGHPAQAAKQTCGVAWHSFLFLSDKTESELGALQNSIYDILAKNARYPTIAALNVPFDATKNVRLLDSLVALIDPVTVCVGQIGSYTANYPSLVTKLGVGSHSFFSSSDTLLNKMQQVPLKRYHVSSGVISSNTGSHLVFNNLDTAGTAFGRLKLSPMDKSAAEANRPRWNNLKSANVKSALLLVLPTLTYGDLFTSFTTAAQIVAAYEKSPAGVAFMNSAFSGTTARQWILANEADALHAMRYNHADMSVAKPLVGWEKFVPTSYIGSVSDLAGNGDLKFETTEFLENDYIFYPDIDFLMSNTLTYSV